MKKLFTILLCFTILLSAFAQEDVRSMGIGGYHVTDTGDIYTLLKNPASLAFADKHNLWLNLQIGANGPLEKYVEIGYPIIDELMNSSNDETQDEQLDETQDEQPDETTDSESMNIEQEIINIVKENNGLATGLNLVGPLNFGFSKNGFGFLFTEELFVDANIPSISGGSVNAGVDANLLIGYGHKLQLGKNHNLSIGVSGGIISRAVNVGITGSITEIIDTVNALSDNIENLPVTSMLGYTVNAGLHYNFANFISVGATYNNILSTTKTIDVPLNEEELQIDFSEGLKSKLEPTLAVGVGIKIPTNFTLGIISSWTAYIDHENVLDLFVKDQLVKNPYLGLNAGTEIVLLNFISLRAGINESYLSAGVGLRLWALNIDAAVYGSELGIEPGAKPNLNAAFSISFKR